MTNKHTPAPWTYKKPFEIVDKKGDYVIGAYHMPEDGDARLIAAAPELLAALEYMIEVCPAIDQQGEEAHQRACAVIAKAKGAV